MKFKDTKYGDLTGKEYDGSIELDDSNLTSLEGAPKLVSGDFNCRNNELTSLEFAPDIVEGSFRVNNNKLISLKHAPKEVYGTFSCATNRLVSLDGLPTYIGGSFFCGNNPDLHSLWPIKKCKQLLNKHIYSDQRLQYQTIILNATFTNKEIFAERAYFETDDENIKRYFIDNFDNVASLVAIKEIF